jgi:hypothetical protein
MAGHMLGRQRRVKPSRKATARLTMARAIVASISVRWDFWWDDFWPSNGQ